MWLGRSMTQTRAHGRSAPDRRSTRHQRAWYWYDWANSAYVTTTTTVLLAPYLTVIAKRAACPTLPSDAVCRSTLDVLGVPVSPGSLVPYTLTISTIISAVLLIVVGALVDRSPRPTRLFGAFAWSGAVAASLIVFVAGTNWLLGVLLLVLANLALGASLVVYDSLLIRIAGPDERDRVSSRGWALGYLGGGLLLALNLGLLTAAGRLGISTTTAVRVSLLSAGLWWALFTAIPILGLRDLHGTTDVPVDLGVLIGIVLGGSQALSRSMYSQLVPRGREAEFFGLYQAMERGTSWFGTLLFGLVQQFTHSYRWAILALVAFFALGDALLSRVRMREGVIAAGNPVPAVL